MKRTLRTLLTTALAAGLISVGSGTASAHPGHGWMKNSDATDPVRVSYYYGGVLRQKWVQPGGTVDPSHTSDVERVYVSNCWKMTVTYTASNGYVSTRTLIGPGSIYVSNGGSANVTDMRPYGC